MSSQTPRIPTQADGPRGEFGAPPRGRHSAQSITTTVRHHGETPPNSGRHRHAAAADTYQPRRSADPGSAGRRRADEPAFGARRRAEEQAPVGRRRAAEPVEVPQTLADVIPLPLPDPVPVPPLPPIPAQPGARRRASGGGRRRAQPETAWNRASGAFQAVSRATADLTRRGLPVSAPASDKRQLSIVVRPLPSPRDALAEQLPAARRAAGVVRDWALSSDGNAHVTGSHRAPGTLQIESWLLIGRHRQRALLAALVAAGLLLIMVPGQTQRPDDISTINAADRSVASPAKSGQGAARKPGRPATGVTAAPAGDTVPDATGSSTAPAPAGSAEVPTPVVPAVPGAPAAVPPSAPAPDVSAAAVVPSANGPAHSLRRTGSDTVALTFDDGPDPVQTPKLLALLAKHQVKATFCLVGERARKHPELVREIVAQGHTLCNHSWSHSFTIGAAKPEDIRADLEATDRAIHDAVPDAPIPYFRAPGGIFTPPLVAVAADYRMASLYWEVDPRDWDHPEDEDDITHVERVVAQVTKDVRPGSIILSHDFNQPDTILAYEQLLPWLAENFTLGMP